MSYRFLISDVVIGGNGANNPIPLSLANYKLSGVELEFVYQQLNVIVLHPQMQVQLQVTGLVQVDEFGRPMINDNDSVYMPCPPLCN